MSKKVEPNAPKECPKHKRMSLNLGINGCSKTKVVDTEIMVPKRKYQNERTSTLTSFNGDPAKTRDCMVVVNDAQNMNKTAIMKSLMLFCSWFDLLSVLSRVKTCISSPNQVEFNAR